MKKIISTSLAIIILLSTSFTIDYGKKIELKLNLKKGDKFYVLMDTEQDITQSMMGQEIEMDQAIKMGYDYDVVDILDNGDYKIQVTYRKIVYKQESQYASVNYDSDDENAELTPQTQGFAALKDQSFNFTCDNKGNVKDVGGVDELMSDMVESMGESLSDEQKAMVKETLKGQFGDQAMKSNLANTMNIYPDKKVGEGDEWSKDIKMNMSMPMTLSNTWKLNSIKDGKAFVTINTIIKALSEAEPMKVQGMEMKYDLEGTQTGEMEIDIETGLAEKSVINQDIKGDMIMSGEQLPEPMAVPINIKSKITLTMTKK